MKQRYLVMVISSCLLAGTAGAVEIYDNEGSKLELYGKLAGVRYISSDKTNEGDQSYVHFGVKGSSQFNPDLSGFGQWEYEVAPKNSEAQSPDSGHTRLAFVGLTFSNGGSLDVGRNYGILYDATSFTDMAPEFGSGHFAADVYMLGRANSLATYRNTGFFGLVDGLNVALQYQAKNQAGEDNSGRGVKEANGQGYGISASYALAPNLTVIGAMAHSVRSDVQNSKQYGTGKYAEAYSAGLKYEYAGLYLAALYSQTYNMMPYGTFSTTAGQKPFAGFASKTRGVELVANYQFSNNLRPSVGYVHVQGDELKQYGHNDLAHYMEVGTTYQFTKNMYSYVDYRINMLRDTAFTRAAQIKTDNTVALGLVYLF